jgi:hypothetical protein
MKASLSVAEIKQVVIMDLRARVCPRTHDAINGYNGILEFRIMEL